MDITVVICTHNRAELLGKMLEVLSQAVYAEGTEIEILTIANACRDNTVPVLERYSEVFAKRCLPHFRWLTEPVPGKSVALNLAIRESRGEVLCFIDDDQFVAPTFFPALTEALARHPEYEIFCGGMVPDWDGSEPSWVHETGPYRIGIRPFPEYDLGDSQLEVTSEMKLPSGGNITVRRDVFTRAGGFSTELGPQGHNLMGGEDLEFVRRAMQVGARILYVPAIQQKHAVEADRMATRYMMRKSYLRSLSNVMMDTSPPERMRPYMFWKPAQFALLALTSLRASQRFYYLIRLAAAFGELRGAFSRQLFPKP
ncbi:MAG: glycosyltransferase [Gallionellaceae bacterium]|nr:glycosyltransferase [Gallionellaceae bacterium]